MTTRIFSTNGDGRVAIELSDHERRIGWLEKGGGFSGAVDLSPFVRKDTLTATGSIYVRNFVGSVVELQVGTDGQVLVVDSTVPEGVRWADSPGVGQFPPYSVTTFTTTHSYVATATTLNELANVLATVVTEYPTLNTSATGYTTTRTFTPSATSLNDMANVLGTVCADLAVAGPQSGWAVVGAYTPTRTYTDAGAITLNILADVLATFIADLIAPGRNLL